MATLKDDAAGTQKKKSVPPPTTPLRFVEALPEAGRAFGISKWPEVFGALIELYETNQAPVNSVGEWAWCNVQQYAKKNMAQTALRKLVSDGHPWQFDLNVKANVFEYAARNNDDGSAIYARLIGKPHTQEQASNTVDDAAEDTEEPGE